MKLVVFVMCIFFPLSHLRGMYDPDAFKSNYKKAWYFMQAGLSLSIAADICKKKAREDYPILDYVYYKNLGHGLQLASGCCFLASGYCAFILPHIELDEKY